MWMNAPTLTLKIKFCASHIWLNLLYFQCRIVPLIFFLLDYCNFQHSSYSVTSIATAFGPLQISDGNFHSWNYDDHCEGWSSAAVNNPAISMDIQSYPPNPSPSPNICPANISSCLYLVDRNFEVLISILIILGLSRTSLDNTWKAYQRARGFANIFSCEQKYKSND